MCTVEPELDTLLNIKILNASLGGPKRQKSESVVKGLLPIFGKEMEDLNVKPKQSKNSQGITLKKNDSICVSPSCM